MSRVAIKIGDAEFVKNFTFTPNGEEVVETSPVPVVLFTEGERHLMEAVDKLTELNIPYEFVVKPSFTPDGNLNLIEDIDNYSCTSCGRPIEICCCGDELSDEN